MKILVFILAVLLFNGKLKDKPGSVLQKEANPLMVKKCNDFSISGNGSNPEWNKASWIQLVKLDAGGENYESKFKIMYSSKGIYLLFSGMDNKITTKFNKDFGNLFEGDVFEAFFHPDPRIPIYFEYEINELNNELVLIIPNLNGKIHGWVPWNYENERKVIKKVHVVGGKPVPDNKINSWSAELFFPYGLLSPLSNVPPQSGTVWHANFCRLDYDSGKMIKWAWAPVKESFHEYEKYRPIQFE